MLRLVAVFLISTLGMFGCKTPQPADVVGTWMITDEARHGLPPEMQKASGALVVSRDWTFEAKELPEELDVDGKAERRLNSGNGTWVLAHFDGGQQLDLEFHSFSSGKLDDRGPYGFPVEISWGWSARELYYFLGDPDQGRRVTLARR